MMSLARELRHALRSLARVPMSEIVRRALRLTAAGFAAGGLLALAVARLLPMTALKTA
jgi:hypothetical protein